MCLQNTDVVIFCGGLGTRLNHPELPKCLVPLKGRPFLEHLFEILRLHCARKIVLLTGHRADRVLEHLCTRPHDELEIEVNHQDPVGVAPALKSALSRLSSPRVLVANGDTLVTSDFCRFVKSSSIWPVASLWTRDAHTTFQGDSGFRIFDQSSLQLAAEAKNFEDYINLWSHKVTLYGTYLDIGTPERLAYAELL